jgi:hypothetical protein
MQGRTATLGALAAGVILALVAVVFAAPAAADPPTATPFEWVFDDLNPCTAEMHTVTISGTTYVHDHDGRAVAYSERTITMSSGFVGHGTDTFVFNGQTSLWRLSDIATNSSGDRIRVRWTLVVDAATGATKAESGAFTCLGPN